MKTEEQINQIAFVCHQTNKAYCRTIGDRTQEDWNQAPDWQNESAVAGVKFKLANLDATPEDMHKNWCKAKLNDGWTYGIEKNPNKKTHPCLLPYDQLPEEQRVKDALFANVVKAFL